MTEAERPTVREWIGIGCVALLFFFLRLPLYRGDALLLGWNSDAGVFGMAGRRIHDGVQFPIFFWAQSYMGLFTSYVSAAIGFLIGDPGRLALRLAAAVEVLSSIILYWLGLRRAFDRGTALMVAAWLAAGPWFLFHMTVAPVGAEQAWFLGGLLFWFVMRYPLRTLPQWFAFGLLCGFMWWINQSAVFVPAAAVIVVIVESEWWSRMRPRIRPLDRLLVRERPHHILVRALGLFLAFMTLLGILFDFGVPVPALFLFSPVAEPLTALVVFHAILFGREWLEVLPRRWFFAAAGVFAIGFVIAYAPVIIGGVRDLYPQSYGLSVPLIQLDHVPKQIWLIVKSDYWMFVGGYIVGILVMIGVVTGFSPSHDGLKPVATPIAAWIIILSVAFYLFSSRAHPGTVRYVCVALPCVYAFAARAGTRWRPAAIVNLVVLIALAFGRWQDTRAVVSAQREYYGGLPGDFDPRPTLAALRRGGYTVCDGDYWVAYKLQWITDERVRFIVTHGYNRNRAEVQGLVSQCHVDEKGIVSAHVGR